MNEQNESEGATPSVISDLAFKPSDGNDISSHLQWPTVLPAALFLANFLPHARETESMPPQRRWLPTGFSQTQTQTQILRGRWDAFILPTASILTILSGPGNYLSQRLDSAPTGLLAVIGSFLLFALGTAAALTKHRWHRTPASF